MASQTYTISSPSQPGDAFYTAVSNFLSTGNCATSTAQTPTPTPPPGGWTFVETYTPNAGANGYTYSTWKSPGADNNAGVDWYLIFQYQTAAQTSGSTYFTVYMCEVYNTSASTGGSPTRAVVPIFGTAPAAPSATSTPPWAAIIASNTTPLATGINSEYAPGYTPNGGTNNMFIAANKDGLVLSLQNSGGVWAAYFGVGETLVTNTAAPDPLLLVSSNLGGATAGATRDPGPTVTYNFGSYSVYPFFSNPGGSAPTYIFGVINGASNNFPTGGDMYAGQQNYPTAFRLQLVKAQGVNGQIQGFLRGLLPTWIQCACEVSCQWGDTVVETGDTMVLLVFPTVPASGTNNSVAIFVDTALA